jgi:hypothetical protein
MNEQEQLQMKREESRREVLAYVAERAGVALSANQIKRGLRDRFTLADVCAAIGFLVSKGFVKQEPDPMGATLYFQITADGTLAHERG